jgi:16S rRNA (cytidine1402-2'-O)-methyltransferase
MGTLFIISTPIGNLDDLTRRAESTFGKVGRVLAEDTRRTRVLLDHIGVKKPTVSLHEHNEAERVPRVLAWLAAGENLGLVSDAGTPLLSDPGQRLVRAVLEAGHDVVPIPGASAALAALVTSGLPAETFVFLGFPPRKGADRTAFLERVAGSRETSILYESPHRVAALCRELAGLCGSEREIAVARELTKLHEEFFRGPLGGAVEHFAARRLKGEVTLVVGPAPTPSEADAVPSEDARALASELIAAGARPSAVARELSDRLGLSRNRAYALVHGGAEEE